MAILSSDAIQISGLQSIVVRTAVTGGGATRVIELHANGSTITGLHLHGQCVEHSSVDTTAVREVTSGGLLLDATALQGTILGVPSTIAAADLADGPVSLPGVALPSLPADLAIVTATLFVVSIHAGSMAMDTATITSGAC